MKKPSGTRREQRRLDVLFVKDTLDVLDGYGSI
jgi:hypothetical protein